MRLKHDKKGRCLRGWQRGEKINKKNQKKFKVECSVKEQLIGRLEG